MISSLSAMLFGGDGQDGTMNQAAEAAADSSTPGEQHAPAKREVRLRTHEEEMGWLLVNTSRSSSPEPLREQARRELEVRRLEGKVDTALRRPDGSIFQGELQLSSSSEESSESEGEQSDDCGAVDFSYFTTAQDLAAAVMSQSSADDEEDEVDSASCYSLAAVTDLSGEETDAEHSDDPSRRRSRRARSAYNDPGLTDSWMVTPPPCFTGTRVSPQVQSNPLEDRLIEQPSLYGRLGTLMGPISSVVEMDDCETYYYGTDDEEEPEKPRMNRVQFFMKYCGGLTGGLLGLCGGLTTCRVNRLHPSKMNGEQKVKRFAKKILSTIRDMEGLEDQEKARAGVWPLRPSTQKGFKNGNASDVPPAPRSVVALRECCTVGARKKKEAKLQRRHQKAREVKHLSSNLVKRTNKATMALSCSRKQMSGRNRGLKPSGNKCGRFGQRAY